MRRTRRRRYHVPYGFRRWTPTEDLVIRVFYPKRGRSRLAEALPGRTCEAVQNRARKLRVRSLRARGHTDFAAPDPSPAEIRQRAAAIRKAWPPDVRECRQGCPIDYRDRVWFVPEVHISRGNSRED